MTLLGGTLAQLAADRGVSIDTLKQLNPQANTNTTYTAGELKFANSTPASAPYVPPAPVTPPAPVVPVVPITPPAPTKTETPPPVPVVSKTLSEYYTAKGTSLPSLSQRAALYQQLGLGSSGTYAGTASQNTALLSALSGASPVVVPAGAIQNREGAYIPTDLQTELRNGATSYNPGTGGQAGIYTEAISGNQYTLDPNSPGGKKYVVKDGKTLTGAAGDINDGINNAFGQSDAQKTAAAQKLIQEQNAAAIKQVATSLGMSEDTVKSLLQSDANVSATYNAALKQIQAGAQSYTSPITPPLVTNGNNAYYKDNAGNVFRTSDNKPVTQGNTDPALDWNKLGLNVGHLNTKENALAGLLPAPIIPGSGNGGISGTSGTSGGTPTGSGSPDPGFDAPTVLKSAIDSSGYTKTQTELKALQDDAAVVANAYQQMHDEITNNPEFPQWLKSRRNEFVSTAETRALNLYNAKIKNLQDQATNQLTIATATYNAGVKQYEILRQEKQDALSAANTATDNDRALLGDIMTQLANQGINWSTLTPDQKATITSQFNDPNMASILGTFDFAKPYDAKQALDWATQNTKASGASKNTNKLETLYGDQYMVTRDSVGNVVSAVYQQPGWGSAPEQAQAVTQFLAENPGVYSKSQINQAFSNLSTYLTDAVANYKEGKNSSNNILSDFSTWKTGKVQGMITTAPVTLTPAQAQTNLDEDIKSPQASQYTREQLRDMLFVLYKPYFTVDQIYTRIRELIPDVNNGNTGGGSSNTGVSAPWSNPFAGVDGSPKPATINPNLKVSVPNSTSNPVSSWFNNFSLDKLLAPPSSSNPSLSIPKSTTDNSKLNIGK